MIYTDLHAHTVFCDGKDTPEDMILSAIEKGLKTMGLVVHSYLTISPQYSVKREQEPVFIKTMADLKEKYKDKIKILCGIEKDFYTEACETGYDYTIGSVHYVKSGDTLYGIDGTYERFEQAVEAFGGDYYALAEEYYRLVGDVVEQTDADIIGHIDLIVKFNEKKNYFDENNPRYINAYKKAIDKLVKFGKPFEINTGAISRGYRTTPYPSKPVWEYIKEKGGKFILSSDSHAKENIAFEYDKWKNLL